MKNKPLAAADITKVVAQALELIVMMFFDMCLRPSQLSAVTGYAPWRGLGELSIYKTEKVLPVLIKIDLGYAALDELLTEIKNACDADIAPAHDPRRMLLKTPVLIPHLYAMAAAEGWDFREVFITRRVQAMPGYPGNDNFQDVPAKDLEYQPPRVDLAAEVQLGTRLANDVNKSDWRIYSSLIGLRLFAAMEKESRDLISGGKMLPGFAFTRYQIEKKEREDWEQARLKRDSERLERDAKKKKNATKTQ